MMEVFGEAFTVGELLRVSSEHPDLAVSHSRVQHGGSYSWSPVVKPSPRLVRMIRDQFGASAGKTKVVG